MTDKSDDELSEVERQTDVEVDHLKEQISMSAQSARNKINHIHDVLDSFRT